jgi:hypothetical protein
MEERRFEELENENAVAEYNCETETEEGNGLLGKVIIGVGVVAAAAGGYLYATREKRKAKKLEKAKKLVMDSGCAIVEQAKIVEESTSEDETTEKTEE